MTDRLVSAFKSLAVLAVSSVILLGFLELSARLVYSWVEKRPFSRREVQGRLLGERVQGTALDQLPADLVEKINEMKDANVPDAPVIIHPYFGFIVNPMSTGVNRFGFFQESPLTKRPPHGVVVVFFGGSLSDQVFYMAKDTLIEELGRIDVLRGKEIKVLSTALGGYKQPQQLIILSYLLSRGAQYDIAINIDGFNEIDSSLDNLEEGINPYYPHNWKLHARQGLDPEAMAHLGRIELIRERRRSYRDFFARSPFVDSVFFLTLWDLLDRGQQAALRRESHALEEILSGGLSPRVRGPEIEYTDPDEVYDDLAAVWQRSSELMAAVSTAYGVSYFHFLQPNQYVPNSKRFTEEEKEVAYTPGWSSAPRIPLGYARLRERGKILQERGVDFVDLTMMFADEDRTVYSDFCCHVNELGARLIARRVAATIDQKLRWGGRTSH